MDGWLTMREDHGLKAICKMRDGIPVATHVTPVDARKLMAWLLTRPDLCLLLWDEAADGQEMSDTNRSLDGTENKGYNAETKQG